MCDTKIQLSIVIPHYNSPRLLEKLLDSIPNRADIQIIVVDDKSNKDMDYYNSLVKNSQPRGICFLHNTTDKKGAGVCRNIGLTHASGKWIMFADSDDYFLPDFFQSLEPYFSSDYDMVYFVPTSIQLDTGRPSSRHVSYAQLVEAAIAHPDKPHIFEMKFNFATPWSKLIRREIITTHDITFDEVAVSNDVMFMNKCAYYAERVTASSDIIYCVTRTGKTLTTVNDSDKFDLRLTVFVNRYNFLRNNLSKKELKYAHLNRIALSRIMDALINGYGFKKVLYVIRTCRKNHIPFLDAGLFNPKTLFIKVKTYLSWRMDDKKYQ